MVETGSEACSEPRPLRWSTERYLALVEAGVIEEGRGVELIDGRIVTDLPQGVVHHLVPWPSSGRSEP